MNPPTYFPEGLPADSPTTYQDGEWVIKKGGARWFVPRNGAGGHDRLEIQKDALAQASGAPSLEGREQSEIASVGKAALEGVRLSTELAIKTALTLGAGMGHPTEEGIDAIWDWELFSPIQ